MKEHISGVTHIFFDLDDTLWDFRANAREAFGILFQMFKGQIPQDVNPETFLDVYAPIAESLWARYGRGEISQEMLRMLRTEAAFAAFGLPPEPWMRKFSDAYVEICPGLGHLFPGTHEVLQTLQGRYTLGILTNGFPEVQQIKLRTSGLEPYFQHIITTDRAESRKPDRKIFDFALSEAGIAAHQAIMAGDHYEIDIITPRDHGWNTILIHDLNPEPDKSHLHIRRIHEIIECI